MVESGTLAGTDVGLLGPGGGAEPAPSDPCPSARAAHTWRVGADQGRGTSGFDLPESFEELLAELPDHLAELIVCLDEDGGILWFNRTAEFILGWRRDDWIGQNVLAVLHPDEIPVAHELLVSARATGPGAKEPVTYRIASAYDGWLPIDVVASSAELSSGRTVLVMSARLNGRARRPEFIVREVGERLSVVFEDAVIGMAQVGLDGRILRANRRFAVRFGEDPVSLHGVSLVGLVAPGDRPHVSRALSQCAAEETASVISAMFGSEPAPVSLHLSLVPDWVGEPLYVFVQLADQPGPALGE